MIIALQTSSGGHLGFILFADVDVRATTGDCIIRALPKDPALFETKEYDFLCSCRDAGEFRFRFEDGRRKLHIQKDSLELFLVRNSPEERYSERNQGLSIFGLLIDEKIKG
jgi:hypothetical protein